jgi:hypothetical protein
MKSFFYIIFTAFLIFCLNKSSTLHAQDSSKYFKIIVVDEESGRGIPLVELRTTNQRRYFTDSNGIFALDDPLLLGQPVFFWLKSHGYEFTEKNWQPLFYALAAKDSINAESSALIPRFEYYDEKGKYFYSTDPGLQKAQRAQIPICSCIHHIKPVKRFEDSL